MYWNSHARSLGALVSLFALVSCSPSPIPATAPAAAAQPADADGDGLDDATEAKLGTSPYVPDTDGDGFSDFTEVVDLGFDPDNDPTRFNPRVADVPEIEVEFVRAPAVTIEHTTSSSESKSFDNSTSNETGESFTSSRTSSHSTRTEVSSTMSATVSANVSFFPFGFGYGGSFTASNTETHGSERSLQWSSSQTRENRRTLSESRGFAQSNDVSRSSGEFQLEVDIRNTGHIPFSLQSLALSAQKLDPEGGHVISVGQVEIDRESTFFSLTSLQPGETLKEIVFKKHLNLEKTEKLLADGPFVVRTSHYELLDVDQVSFDHRFTSIGARTATLVIDHGVDRPIRTYRVATHTAEGRGLALDALLRDVLKLPVETGTTLWKFADRVGSTHETLLALDGDRADSKAGSYWVATHATREAGKPVVHGHHPLEDDLDLASWKLRAGDLLRLVYVTDADRDGLGTRGEQLYGTSPTSFDTDGDGVGDGAEVEAGRQPTVDEEFPGVKLAKSGVYERRAEISLSTGRRGGKPLHALRIDWGDGTPAEIVAKPDPELVRSHHYTGFGRYAATVTAFPAAERPGRTLSVPLTVAPRLVEDWVQQLGSPAIEMPNAIATTAYGSVFVAGTVMNLENATVLSLDVGQNGAVFLLMYDKDGERQWLTQFGRPGSRALDVDASSYTRLVALMTHDPGTKAAPLVSLYDWNGRLKREWQLPQELADATSLEYIAEQFYVSGTGAGRGFAARLDSSGKAVWVQRFEHDAAALDVGRRGVTVAGLVREMDSPTSQPTSMGIQVALFAKDDGRPLWSRRVVQQTGSILASPALAVDGEGGIYVGSATTGRVSGPNRGSFDAFVMRLSPKGEALWARQLGTRGADIVTSLSVDERHRRIDRPRWEPCCTVHVSGITNGRLEDEKAEVSADAPSRSFVASFDHKGRRRFLYTSVQTDFFRAPMASDSSGSVFLAGDTKQAAKPGYENRGGSDLYVIKLVPNTGKRAL